MLTQQEWTRIQRMIGAAAKRNDHEAVDEIRRDFYIYESESLGLAFGTSDNDIINIESDSDFILQKLAYQADIAAVAYTDSARPIPNITVNLIDSGSGRQLMSEPVPVASYFGTGELPFILTNPKFFSRNSTIQIAYTNFDAAITYNLRLAFIGYKIYDTL